MENRKKIDKWIIENIDVPQWLYEVSRIPIIFECKICGKAIISKTVCDECEKMK